MSATVYSPAGVPRTVKNLGWLLRHWTAVRSFRVTASDDDRWDATLSALLDGGDLYVTDFADRTVLAGFLDRPVFRGVEVSWLGEVTECGRPLNVLTGRCKHPDDVLRAFDAEV